eukprot:g16585.t1
MEEDHPKIEPRAGAPPPQPGEPEDPGVDFSKAKIGQMGPESRRRVLKMLQECKGFFPKHAKIVNVLTGREVELPLYDENAKPFACEAQRFNPHMSDILVDQIKDMLEAGILSFANSEWGAKMVPVKKSDGTYRICIDYRKLIKLLRKNVGGLGDILGLYDRMKGSKYFSSIDLKSVYHRLPIKRSDRHKTAFRDPSGRLLQWNVASLGISTIPAVFSSTLGDDLRSVMGEGVVKWLDDIGFYSKTFNEHLELIRKVVKILIKHGYTGNFLKSEFFLSEIEFLGVMVGRDGIRPAPSKIKAVQELAIPTTVGEMRSFLGLAGYLRGFVEDFSAITAPISDLLRNKRFSSKRARHLKVPFDPDQVNAFVECIKRLTTHPVMLLPDWNLPLTLHTDASTLATGAVLTQEVDGGSRQGPPEPVPKMHRWALKLMAYDMVLKWRRGTENVGPHPLSRLRRRAAEEPEAEEDEVLEGELTPSAAGPVLEGVPLRELTPPLEGERRPQLEDVTDLPSELLALAEMSREEIVLDGTLEEAEELSWQDYVKLTTTREDFAVPNTMRRRDTARVLEEWTLPPMLREVLSLLQLKSMERGTAEAPGERMQKQGGPRYQEGELMIGLAALQLEEPSAATAGEPPFDRSRFKVIPRETRAAAAARKAREAKEAQSAAEVDPSPPLQEPEQENSHMESSELQDSPSPEEPALSPQPMSTTEEPDRNMPDTEPPAPAAEASSETAVIPVCRGHSDQLEKMERVLRDPVELSMEQQRDFVLGPIRKDVEEGKGQKGDYVLDDQNLLFHAPRGKLHVIALPRRLIPAVLALPHGTFGHPGIARTTIIIADKYHWPSLKKDLSPSLDNSGSAFGFESTVEETRRKHVEVAEVLRKRRDEKNRPRDLQNARISRTSPGAKARLGDKMLVRESASTLHRDGVHPKLAHDHFTGPWVVVNVVRAGLSFTVRLNGRQVRHRTVAASDMKLFHSRPKDLQLPFEDEFSHFVWGPDLGLVEDSVVAAPLYTLIDRKPTQGAGRVSEAWAWEYRGKYQDGSTSSWLTEDEVKDSFSPLQLDVFHALWEDYHGPDIAPRPPGAPTRGEREVATREAALKEFPLNTEVGRELQDNNGYVIITRGKVCDFYDPYWRVDTFPNAVVAVQGSPVVVLPALVLVEVVSVSGLF